MAHEPTTATQTTRSTMQGRVVAPWLDSKVLLDNLPGDPTRRQVPVYLPPGYDDTDRRYSTIFVLSGHGSSGAYLIHDAPWTESLPQQLDRLITSGAMPPVIAVMPDCWTVFGGSQFVNSTALGPYEDYLNTELVPHIDATYRTVADREHRAVVGKSSGGYGAMVQSMRHPELWGAAASHSGDIYFEFGYLPDLAKLPANLRRLGGLERFIDDIASIKPKTHDPFFSVLGMLCYGAAFAPDPTAPRGFRLPIDDQTGALVPEIWDRWLAWDPVRMIENPAHQQAWRSLRYLYLDCGEWDELNFAVGTRVIERRLNELDIPADVEFFDDGHLGVGYRYDVSLPRVGRAITTD